jgi:hypothetical protein
MSAARALALGLVAVVGYLAGVAASGALSPLARRPLLDGLAPPAPYRWVKPPPDLTAANKPPAGIRFSVEMTAKGSELAAFSTEDGQVNVVLSEGAIPASPGQTAVEVTVDPLDPATLASPPAGLVVAGNAYRIRAHYRPSGRAVATFSGESSVGLVYPLLTTPLLRPSGHLVLASADGTGWERLVSTDNPGSHQVSAALARPGYLAAAVPMVAATAKGRARTGVLLVAGAAVVLIAAVVVLRRRLGGAGPPGRPRPGPSAAPGRPRPRRGGGQAGKGRPNPARRRRRR